MTRVLARELRRFRVFWGEGRLGAWSEVMVGVAMSPVRGRLLARRFGQNAVVVAWPGRVVRLVWSV